VGRAETGRFPRAAVAAVAAAAGLRVIEVDLVANMVGVTEAGVAKHAGLVLLARLADPHDIVASKRVLADLAGAAQAQLRNRGGGGRKSAGRSESVDEEEA
jgi:hypothetical protein